MKETIEELIKKLDWEDIAKSFAKEDIKWHANEWREFIKEIKSKQIQEIKKRMERHIHSFTYPENWCYACNTATENCKVNSILSDILEEI